MFRTHKQMIFWGESALRSIQLYSQSGSLHFCKETYNRVDPCSEANREVDQSEAFVASNEVVVQFKIGGKF